MFEPTDWSDSRSLHQMVQGLAFDFIKHLMVGLDVEFALKLPKS